MRLLFVTQYDPLNLAAGGPAYKVRALSDHLARRGHSVTIITAAEGKLSANHDQLHPWEMDSRVNILHMRTLIRYRAITFNPAIWAVARREVPRADVIHLFGFYNLLGPIVARIAQAHDVPYVLEPMGMVLPIVHSLRKKRLYYRWLGHLLVAAASRVIATAPREREDLIQAGIAVDSISVRRNGIDLEDFATLPEPGILRQRLGIAPEKKLVLYLGRLSRKKNPDLLMRAFASINSSNVRLLIAGPDMDGYAKELRELRASLGLEDHIFFSGPLYDEDKLSALVDADVFVLPSQNENFGNVIAESIAAGTPVVISDQCGIAPYVRDKAGLVVPVSQNALEAALTRLLFDRSLYQNLVHGCTGVANELTWDEPVSLLEGLYRSLMV